MSTRRIATAALLALLPLGLFVLPYRFHQPTLILSASAEAGFNNNLAYAWYAATLAVLAWVSGRGQFSEPAAADAPAPGTLFVWPSPVVWLVMAVHAALFGALYIATRGFVFAEALYFQDAAYRVVAGAVPFVDFNFFYGPLLLSPIAFLSRFIGLLGAYGVYYVLSYVAGLYLLFVVLSALVPDRRRLTRWYVFFAFGFFNGLTGLNYTFGRFLLPFVALLASWSVYRNPSARRWIGAVAVVLVAFWCSPDIAVATTAGIGVFGALLLLTHSPGPGKTGRLALLTAVPLAGAALAALSLLLIDGTVRPVVAYLKPILTFSAGGWNTPIDPSLPILCLVGATAVVVARLRGGWFATRGTDAAPLLAALGVTAVLLQRASLGKADVLHVAFSGLPVFLLLAARMPGLVDTSRKHVIAAALLMVGVVIPLQFFNTMMYVPSLLTRWTSSAPAARAASAAPRATKTDVQASLARAVEHFGPERTFYMHRLEYYRLPIYLRYRLKPFMFHPSLTSAFTSRDIDEVIGLLRQSRAVVLVLKSDLSPAVPSDPPATPWSYYLTSSPLPGSYVYYLTLQFQTQLEAPLVRFLKTAYQPAFEDGDIVGLVLRPDQVARAGAVQ